MLPGLFISKEINNTKDMGQYLHHYETENAFNAAYNGNDYHEPWVSYTDETEGQEHVDYNKVIDLEIYYTNDGEVRMTTDGARILHASEGIGIVEEIWSVHSGPDTAKGRVASHIEF